MRPAVRIRAAVEFTDDDEVARIASVRSMTMIMAEATRRRCGRFTELWRDVPFGISGAGPSFEACVAEELEDPAFGAAGSFVAVDGDDWIGRCTQSAAGRHLMTSMTGVVAGWRRHGLARWLKLHSIRYALETGTEDMSPCNDATNEGMPALNRELGFEPVETDWRLRKER